MATKSSEPDHWSHLPPSSARERSIRRSERPDASHAVRDVVACEIHSETGRQGAEREREGLVSFSTWTLVGPSGNVKRSLREHFTFPSEWKISLSSSILVPQTVRSPSFVPRPSGGGARLDLPTTSLRLSPSHARSCDDERCRVTRAALRPSPAAGRDASACAEQARRMSGRLKFASKMRKRFARGDEGPGRNRSKAPPSRLPGLHVSLLIFFSKGFIAATAPSRERCSPRQSRGLQSVRSASNAALGLTSCDAMRPMISLRAGRPERAVAPRRGCRGALSAHRCSDPAGSRRSAGCGLHRACPWRSARRPSRHAALPSASARS